MTNKYVLKKLHFLLTDNGIEQYNKFSLSIAEYKLNIK